MKAAVLLNPRRLEYRDVDDPKPRPNEVLLRVKAASICGSDLLRVYGGAAHFYPIILGHEAAGIVAGLGDGIDQEMLGMRAVLVPLIPCMTCSACSRQIYSSCERYSFIGSRQDGSFAEYVVVPVQNLIPLADEISFEIGAVLEPATVALHALQRDGSIKGRRVAILGTGSVGLCAVQWARIMEAELIIATDIEDDNLELARQLGADVTVNPLERDVASEIKAVTKDGVDLAMEVAGSPHALEQAIIMARPQGVVVCVGNQPPEAQISTRLIEEIVRHELDMRGAWMSYSDPFPGREWTETMDAVLRGDLDIEGMISHRFPLSAVEEVFGSLNAKTLPHRKVILSP